MDIYGQYCGQATINDNQHVDYKLYILYTEAQQAVRTRGVVAEFPSRSVAMTLPIYCTVLQSMNLPARK